MSQNKAHTDKGGNNVQKQGAGDMVMDQKKLYAIATVGTTAIPPEALLSGIINRTGSVAGYADTWPTAASLLAACPELDVGDAFEFLVINGVAFADTTAAPDASVVLVNGTITASLIKRFMVSVLADGPGGLFSGQITNTLFTVTLNDIRNAKYIQPGMGVSGTGIGASAVVTAVNLNTGVITLSVANTATNAQAGVTFFPRIEVRGLYQAAA